MAFSMNNIEAGEFTTVGIVIIGASVTLIAYDIWLYATKRPSLSTVLTKFSYYSPILPFIAGLLCGHWFW